MENLKQLEAQKSTLENTEWEKIKLTQRLHENLTEIRSVTKERTPGLGISPGEGNGNPLQYSCLENSIDCSLSEIFFSPSLITHK